MPLSKKQTYGLVAIGAGIGAFILYKKVMGAEDFRPPGTLTIITQPAGAIIEMLLPEETEWQSLGPSPVTITLPSTLKYPSVGRPMIRTSMQGYAAFMSEVDIKPGTHEMIIPLTPLSGGWILEYEVPFGFVSPPAPGRVSHSGLAADGSLIVGFTPTFVCVISNPNNAWITRNISFVATVYSGFTKIRHWNEIMPLQIAPAGFFAEGQRWDKTLYLFDYRRTIQITLHDGSKADVQGAKIIFQPGQTVEMHLGDDAGNSSRVVTVDINSPVTDLSKYEYYRLKNQLIS